MRTRRRVAPWLAAATVLAITSPVATSIGAGPRRLGKLKVLSGPTACDSQQCYRFEVTCPEVAQAEQGLLKVSEPRSRPRATVLLTSGGVGTGLFGPQRIVSDLVDSGFRTVQLAWNKGWPIGSPEAHEGLVRLACRPATVASWVSQNLTERDTALCAAGGSGGATQVSYMLTHYGLEKVLSLVMPLAGYWVGRMDLGCLGEDPLDSPLHYSKSARAWVDQSFGFPPDGSGPCSQRDKSFAQRFRRDSVASDGAYFYPNTLVWFVFGGADTSGSIAQGMTYHRRLLDARSPSVRFDLLPNVPHDVTSSPEGASRVSSILLSECRARRPAPK